MPQHTPTTRRGFINAGSTAFALGVLTGVPGMATAEQASTITGASVTAQIAAILDRPNPTYFGEDRPRCDCARCSAIRRRGIDCTVCGFHGEPLVAACECREARADRLDHHPPLIAAIEAGEADALKDWGVISLAPLRTELAEAQSQPDRMCVAHADRSRHARQAYHCGHGSTTCPTCGSIDDNEDAKMDGETIAATIRELRALLARVH